MKKPAIIAFLIGFIWLLVFYRPMLFHPNAYIFGCDGDAVKNYAAFAGHIKNDSSYLVYQNMNYPYKLDYIYTDGNFILGNALKALSNIFPFIARQSFAIYNYSLLLSIPLCAFFLSLIFSRLRLPGWFNVLAAIAITMLSPQIVRLPGHTTLAYTFFIPMSWWLFLKYRESEKKITYAIIIALHLLLWYFVHPYPPVIFISFILCFFLVRSLTIRPYFRIPAREYTSYAIMIFLPLVCISVLMKLLDHHTGRPQHPWGFWEGYASFLSVFTPDKGPFEQLFKEQFGVPEVNWEGLSYVSLPSALIAMFCLWRLARYLLKRRAVRVIRPVAPQWLGLSALAALLVLLYSMAFPFRFRLQVLLEWFPVLHQFRALGRFAWIFYFIFNVYAFYILYQVFRLLRFKKLRLSASTLIVVFFVIFFTEAYYRQHDAWRDMNLRGSYFNKDEAPEKFVKLVEAVEKIKGDYQAFITLPFFNIGTDNFTTKEDYEALRAASAIQYFCNFPSIVCCSARVPMQEGKNIQQFVTYPFIKKEIEADLPSKKDFLVVYTGEDLDETDRYWLSVSEKIWEGNGFQLLRLKYDEVFGDHSAGEWQKFDQAKPTLIQVGRDIYSTKPGLVRYLSFDSLKNDIHRYGEGTFSGNVDIYCTLIDRQTMPFEENREYKVSYWTYNKEERQMWYSVVAGENDIWTHYYSGTRSKQIDGDWSLVEGKFKPENVNNVVVFFTPPERYSKRAFYVDEFLLRPADADVYRIMRSDSTGRVTEMIKNNLYFTRN